MWIEPGQHREKRAGGVIFEPMGWEKAGVGVAIPAGPPGKAGRESGALARRRMEKEGGMIFEPMGRERAPAGPPGKTGRGSGAFARRRMKKEGDYVDRNAGHDTG